MHYCIFIPGVRGYSDDHLRKVGLDTLADCGIEWSETIGPNNQPGMMGTWRQHSPEIINPPSDAQAIPKWRSFNDAYWIGWDPDRPPMPVELARKEQFTANPVILGDGNIWMIPVAQRLPHKHRLSPDGIGWVRRISRQYEEFYEQAQRHMLSIFRDLDILDIAQGARLSENLSQEELKATHTIHLTECDRFCADALAINYRMHMSVIDVLDLFDDQSVVRTVLAVIDMQDILAVRDEKKSEDVVDIPLGSTI